MYECRYRGPVVATEKNDGGHWTKIFECEIHQRCALKSAIADVTAVCRKCKQIRPPELCRYLLDPIRMEVCGTCKGAVKIKILKCAVYRECTIATEIDGVQCCQGCDSYETIEQ